MLFKSLLGFVAVAAASPISTEDYTKALETRDGIRVSDLDFTNMKFYAQHAAAAYCNSDTAPGKTISCRADACPLVMQNKPTVIASMVGKLTGIGAYVASDPIRKEIVLSVRGSNNIRNFITDVVFAWRDCEFTRKCKLHTGFAKSWDEIKDATTKAIKAGLVKNPDYKLVITGHSLGGAVATIGAAYLRRDGLEVDVYTFGSPRVGNDKFANWFSAQPGGQWRVTHENDPVPRLPPILFGYRHVTPEYWLNGGSATKMNYTINQVKVCQGIASIGCNAGTLLPDIFAHLHYLGDTAACTGFPLQLRGQEDPLPEDLKQRLAAWSQKDQDYVNDN